MVMVMKMKALIVKALIVMALLMVMVLMLMPTTILLNSNHLQAPNTCAAFAGTGEIQNICCFTFFTLFCQLENNILLGMRHPDHKDDVVLPGQAENIMGCTPVRVAKDSSRGRSVLVIVL